MKKHYIYTILLALSIMSCAPKIYLAPNFDRVTRKHKIVAILPADVSLRLRPKQAEKLTKDQIHDQEEKIGYEIQNSIYTWFLKRIAKYNYTVRFQDITKTNSILKKAGIQFSDIKSKDRTVLGQLLGVDAIIQDISVMDKPMSEGAAVAVGVLLGAWGSTNRVTTTLNIHDTESGDLLWKYDFLATGSVGSSSDQLVNNLLRNASRKFPYQSEGK